MGISPGTVVEVCQRKREPEKKAKLYWLIYPDKLKSEMRGEGENTRKGKIAIKQGNAAYEEMGTGNSGNWWLWL